MEIYKNLSIESLPNEEWRDIVGYEGLYQVSNLGRVKSLERLVASPRGLIEHIITERILSIKVHKFGYLEVSLHSKGKSKTYKVHRLVALSFIPNPNGLLEINHKDENKSNNIVDNLEWCTAKYNANYGNRNKKSSIGRSKGIIQYDLKKVIVAEYESLTKAGESVGGNPQGIFLCANNKIKKYKGYIWRYKG